MHEHIVKKNDLFVQAEFSKPAFSLLRPDPALHQTVANALSPFCSIRGDGIRIESDTLPLGNANVLYDLDSLEGFARVWLDKAQAVFFNPPLVDAMPKTRLIVMQTFLQALHDFLIDNSFNTFQAQITRHLQLQNSSPAEHIQRYVRPLSEVSDIVIGNAVSYHFGSEGSRVHSSLVLDMSSEFSDCIFIRITVTYDALQLSVHELSEHIIQHCHHLLFVAGLGPKQ